MFGAPVHLSPSPNGNSVASPEPTPEFASPRSNESRALDLRSQSALAGSLPPPPEAPVTCIEMLRLLSMFRSAAHEFRACFRSWIKESSAVSSVIDTIQAAHDADIVLFPRVVALATHSLPPDSSEMQDFVSVTGTLSSWSITMWQEFIRIFPSVRHSILQSLRVQRRSAQMHRWRRCLFLDEAAPSASPLQVQVGQLARDHGEMCRNLRAVASSRSWAIVPVDDLMFGSRLDTGPVLFVTEQHPTLASAAASPIDTDDIDIGLMFGCHVVVCVHGFQGSHYDLRIWRQCLALHDPDLVFLMSSVNEERTGNSIVALGAALAQEVTSFCSSRNVMRLSFIAHSLGGLITREAIGHESMEQYSGVLHTLVTLGSPHLGYLFSKNSLVDSAMWLMKKVKDMPALHQLAMSDSPSKSQCYLSKAAASVQLNRFKHIVLVASPQDGYVPFYSARMEVPQESLSDRLNGPLIIGMANALLAPLVQDGSRVRSISRVEAQFLIEADGMDKRIGRAAHIMFLDNTAFIQMFVGLYAHLFPS